VGSEGDWLFSDWVTSFGSLLTELLPALRGQN